MSKIILKESYLYLLGEVISKGIPVFLLPYMAKKMGVNELANFSLYQSIIAIASVVILLSMDGAIARYYHRYGFRSISILRRIAVTISAALCLVIITISLLLGENHIAISALASFCYVLLMLNFSIAQASRQVHKYFLAQVISGVTLLFSIIILFEFTQATSQTRVYAGALSWFIPSLWLFFTLKTYTNRINKKINKKHILYLFSFGLPLLLHALSGVIRGHVERFIINDSFSKSALAEYFLAIQIASIFYLLLLALNRALVPHFYAKMKNRALNTIEVKQLVLKSFLIVPLFPIFVYLIPDSLFVYIFGDEYTNLGQWVAVLVLGYSLMIPYFILVNLLFYQARNKLISSVSIFVALIHIGISCIFSLYSMDLLVYSLFFSSILQICIMYFCTFKDISKVKQ
ncbi:oligosaccharide flippase family protein [Pseudoalteromonas sp. APC 3358]|uniref:oligosaccharide flippase family protein n=1 Tax=unclassified Pseudoalteromonas TaxID=194690 RepID=UPI0025B3B4CC|nr:oligosaccharide flippase family protein [Pseudoalteromonas sp. APC 3358]MDN3384144.1 oligosaccharide flippase family protein [Pseudoalteromonas sp. APC 3358]